MWESTLGNKRRAPCQLKFHHPFRENKRQKFNQEALSTCEPYEENKKEEK